MHHGDFDIAHRLRTAFVHLRNLLSTLFAKPTRQLGNPNHHRVVLLDDLHGISNMIAMAMCAKQNIDLLHLLFRIRAHGIIHDPGIDDHSFAAQGLNAECCMS